MLEEVSLLAKQSSKWYTQKSVLMDTNKQVIKLIKDKLIPLNKNRYGRLQKINPPGKQQFSRQGSEENIVRRSSDAGQNFVQKVKTKISKGSQHQTAVAGLMMNRLKNARDLKGNNQIMVLNGEAGRCWQTLRLEIAQLQQKKELGKLQSSQLDGCRSSRSRKKQYNLIQLAERAQRYLRQRKRKLKEEYRQQQQDYYGIRGQQKANHSQIDYLLFQLKPGKLLKEQTSSKTVKARIDEQMRMQITEDIHESMFEEKIYRIKKDVNHKKMVQMR